MKTLTQTLNDLQDLLFNQIITDEEYDRLAKKATDKLSAK